MSGKLYGVGLGPGDPNLMTLRAAQAIAERHLRPDHIEERLVYPVTTEATDHPGGYRGAMEEFYADAAARRAPCG